MQLLRSKTITINLIFFQCRYALDVNAERAEDVLTHKRLLKLAKGTPNEIVFEVRIVQVTSCPISVKLSGLGWFIGVDACPTWFGSHKKLYKLILRSHMWNWFQGKKDQIVYLLVSCSEFTWYFGLGSYWYVNLILLANHSWISKP